MNSVFRIIGYVFNKNSGVNFFKYLLKGFVFQIFKRVTGSIVSKKIFNGKKIFLYPNCNVSSMYAYTDIPDKEEIIILRNLIIANVGGVKVCF